jgi:hypothetical protein
MIEDFNDLPWHDASLVSVYIDRRNPGHCDEVRIRVRWPNENVQTLVFFDCFAFSAKMNFGIIANESILDANEYVDHERLDELKRKLHHISSYIADLKYYVIETNSTGGVLEIFAKYIRFLNEDDIIQ